MREKISDSGSFRGENKPGHVSLAGLLEFYCETVVLLGVSVHNGVGKGLESFLDDRIG